jgi:beta-lactamase class A
MGKRGPGLLRLLSIVFILAAVGLFFYELISYSRARSRLPLGLTIADVPVGGLDQDAALQRLLSTYSMPVELYYGDNLILLSPSSVGFRMDMEGMLAMAELMRTGTNFWAGFWDFLWSRPGTAESVPLRSEFSQTQLHDVLLDIAARYDEPPTPALPIPGRPEFLPGKAGHELDVGRAAELVGLMLNSPSNRRVNLPVASSEAAKPPLSTLETLMKQILEVGDFDGLADVFVKDLRTGDVLHFIVWRGRDLSTQPDIAFTAGSTNKVGIMVTFYRYFDEPFDAEAERWLKEMIMQSGNDPSDWLMERLDPELGPLKVTETMRELGLQSTFLAGYYHLGAELLRIYQTPGNQRSDINTRPDIYNQTTPAEIGMLLSDIYACTRDGGTLLAAYPGQITPDECREMMNLLSQNKVGILIEASVPEGTRVAHKHGWTSSPLEWVADTGVVYTPGGDYVFSAWLWNDREMIWDPTSTLFTELARATYNYFNPPSVPLGGGGE